MQIALGLICLFISTGAGAYFIAWIIERFTK
jgi:hypothetical protein